jgi:hypothetical protein
MTQIFHPSANTLAKASIAGLLLIVAGALVSALGVERSPYSTRVGTPIQQPIPFSHEHHVQGLGIHCMYCHDTVEKSSFAGMPSTHTCMSCHSQIWLNSEMLEPVRRSYTSGKPLVWNRVHDLSDFVYFDHSIHVRKGVGCSSCHGAVQQMPQTWKVHSLRMEWCLDCHRNPEQNLRPAGEIFNMDWSPAPNQKQQGQLLKEKYETPSVQLLTSCSTCHH